MTYDIGEIVTRTLQIVDSSGAAVNADSLPAYALTDPTGAVVGSLPSVQTSGTGAYFIEPTGSLAGRYEDVWTAVVGGKTLKFGPGVFHVRAASGAPVVDVADFRIWLGLTDYDVTRDELLRDILDAATRDVEAATDRKYRRQTVTETRDGGTFGIALRRTPAQSITTVVESGITLAATDYTLTPTNVLVRGGSTAPGTWSDGVANVVITYVVGATSVDEDVRLGILERGRVLFEPQRGGSGLPRQSAPSDGLASLPSLNSKRSPGIG